MGRKRKLENRDAILKASYRLFMERGYDNVTVYDIEKDSKINTRNLYRYFKNKDEILGEIIRSIEKRMLEYIEPLLYGDPFFTFVLFSVMKHEFALLYPDYFRMRASLIARPDTSIKNLMELFALSYPQNPDWKSDERSMMQGLYLLGGTLFLQYGFIENLAGNILSDESSDFMTNYEKHKLSAQTAETFRRFLDYAIINNLHILGLAEDKAQEMLRKAYTALGTIDLSEFRRCYEKELGFC